MWNSTYTMFNTVSRAVLLLLTMVLLNACVQPVKQAQPEAPEKSQIPRTVDSDIQDLFDESLQDLKQEKYQQAVDLLTQLVEKEPRFPAPFVNLGMAYEKLGDKKNAEISYHKALAIDLGHARGNNALGLLYRKEGRFQEARKAYTNALADHPDYLPARKNLAILCDLYLRDYPCALENYEAYLEQQPDDKQVKIWITDLKQRMGQ